jgi:hypothetical protein
MTQQIVIDIPASLATVLPSTETLIHVGTNLAVAAVIAIVFFGACAILVGFASVGQRRRERIAKEKRNHENLARHAARYKTEVIDRLRQSTTFTLAHQPAYQRALNELLAEGRVQKIDDFGHYRVLAGD